MARVVQGSRVRLDNRGTGKVLRLLEKPGEVGHYLPYAEVRWDSGDVSWEWVYNLVLIK